MSVKPSWPPFARRKIPGDLREEDRRISGDAQLPQYVRTFLSESNGSRPDGKHKLQRFLGPISGNISR